MTFTVKTHAAAVRAATNEIMRHASEVLDTKRDRIVDATEIAELVKSCTRDEDQFSLGDGLPTESARMELALMRAIGTIDPNVLGSEKGRSSKKAFKMTELRAAVRRQVDEVIRLATSRTGDTLGFESLAFALLPDVALAHVKAENDKDD